LLSFGCKLCASSEREFRSEAPVQIIDGEVQELPSGREMPDVVPTIGLLQITKE
jgi:hypothetical protein